MPPTPISPVSEAFDSPVDEKMRDFVVSEQGRKLMKNKRATISHEELIAGLSAHSSEDDDDEYSPRTPGAFPHPTQEELSEQYFGALMKQQKEEELKKREEDPTLIYSTLLIAKPLPFKFDMTVRNRSRAEHVMGEFIQKRAEGEFKPSREYWGPNQGAGKELGWGKV